MKSKKIIPIIISFAIVVISSAVLIWLLSIYNSHKIYKTITFNKETQLNGKVAVCDSVGYLYNEFGGSLEKSDLSSIPLSQYEGPDEDYLFYKFNSKYYGVSDLSRRFNGGNDSVRFLYKSDKVLYLINTEELTCTAITPEIEFHSASTNGTYLLEIKDNKYNFYKRVNLAYDLYPAVTMLLNSENIEFVNWINDRYILVKADTDKGYIYLIADAETGETLTCMSIYDTDEEYKKDIYSTRYFVKEYLENEIVIFDIYTQENITFKKSNAKEYSVLKISGCASYAVVERNGNAEIISANGKFIDISTFISGDYLDCEFILDNILFISYIKDGKTSASIYKILF